MLNAYFFVYNFSSNSLREMPRVQQSSVSSAIFASRGMAVHCSNNNMCTALCHKCQRNFLCVFPVHALWTGLALCVYKMDSGLVLHELHIIKEGCRHQ